MKAFKAFIKSFAVPQRSVKIKFYHEFFSLSGIGMRRVKWRKINSFLLTALNSLQVFSDRYVECNPGKVTDNPDAILLLAFALAMLNTDLHNQNVKCRMTIEDFIKNLRGADNGNTWMNTCWPTCTPEFKKYIRMFVLRIGHIFVLFFLLPFDNNWGRQFGISKTQVVFVNWTLVFRVRWWVVSQRESEWH